MVHEVTSDGQVYYGANADPGNTDETVKFPSAVALVWRWTGDNGFRDDLYDVAVRNMRYALALDADGDGWPEGSGNVERTGMGPEKLDVAVYTIRGLLDLADMAAVKGDRVTARWAAKEARDRARPFEQTWWYGGDANSYADSLSDPGNLKLFQRYWIGATPMEAELPAVRGASRGGPLASTAHANVALTQRERDCFTGEFGFYHTGTGPTSDPAGNKGSSCDSVVRPCNPSGTFSRWATPSWRWPRATTAGWPGSGATPARTPAASWIRASGRCRVQCRRSFRHRTSVRT